MTHSVVLHKWHNSDTLHKWHIWSSYTNETIRTPYINDTFGRPTQMTQFGHPTQMTRFFREVHDNFLEFQMTIWSSGWWLKFCSAHFERQQSPSSLNVLPLSRYNLCLFWKFWIHKMVSSAWTRACSEYQDDPLWIWTHYPNDTILASYTNYTFLLTPYTNVTFLTPYTNSDTLHKRLVTGVSTVCDQKARLRGARDAVGEFFAWPWVICVGCQNLCRLSELWIV